MVGLWRLRWAAAAAWAWARFFVPKSPGRDKNAHLLCGLAIQGRARISFRSEYYLYSDIFWCSMWRQFFLCLLPSLWRAFRGGVLAMVVFLLCWWKDWLGRGEGSADMERKPNGQGSDGTMPNGSTPPTLQHSNFHSAMDEVYEANCRNSGINTTTLQEL